ncbi:MAG TPA: DUF5684 domain-containing protein [Opitutaceae bacterium]|nr:DUF5684 domain-containing protein [Opitutaceae bacterium]HRJ48034.1 DUF5684 domain-containing protein [Opitutaceae bacterium]
MEIIVLLIQLAIVVAVIAGVWKTFAKAGQPGWAAIIPIYNVYILLKIANRPWWWLLLMLIPLVNLVIAIIVAIDVAKAFGKGAGFGIGLALLGLIFYPILGFGSATYTQPVRTA